MTPGQAFALEKTKRVARDGGAVELLGVEEPTTECPWLRIELSLYCGDMEKAAGGLPIRNRERVKVWVGKNFPYYHPSATVEHQRFAGYPHVNWSRHLCLYQAAQTEWSPRDHMFGFLERLELWFRLAAVDQLDPTGGPLHPPVTYSPSGPIMIPRRNAPVRSGELWSGLADLVHVSDRRVDIVGWRLAAEAPGAGLVGAAILLDRRMPLEFPSRLADLLACLEQRGVSLDVVFDSIRVAVAHNGKEQPLYVVLGTPMRGVRGQDLRQHLTAWRVDSLASDLVRLEADCARNEATAQGLGATELAEKSAEVRRSVIRLFRQWSENTDVTWCRMREDRPEVTIRRDTGRPATAFAGRTVEIWGCGALGGYIAEWVVRAGAARVVVRDQSIVSPGILVRQPYRDAEIGYPKAEVLAARLRRIKPDCEISAHVVNVVDDPLGTGMIGGNADIVIDATASIVALAKVEELWRQRPETRCTVASVVIDQTAERLMAVVVRREHSGGPLDVVRRMKLAACRDDRLHPYLDAFFSDPAPAPFQPEPGCSDATFLGSAADAAQLSAAAANFIGGVLLRDSSTSATGCFLTVGLAQATGGEYGAEIRFEPDLVFTDPGSRYETRVERSAWRAMKSWRNESKRVRGETVETGGLLLGEIDEFLRVVWVSEASGPPPDSHHSADGFICGTAGTEELNNATRDRTRKSVQYVGTWHTHPVSAAIPSAKDFHAADQLLLGDPTPAEHSLMMIVGKNRVGPEVSANVFLREEFEFLPQQRWSVRGFRVHAVRKEWTAPKRRVGLALSGGGSRAIAFHLGCLRALHDRDVLSQVQVISTVSGGSVIGAMFAYGDGSFADFQKQVRSLLRSGLVMALARRTFFSPRLLQIAATKMVSGLAADAAFITRFVIGQAETLVPRQSRARGLLARNIQPPLRRWVSRTNAFEDALRDTLYGRTKLQAKRRDDFDIVINACELRTGTAFRFGSRETGTWRYRTIADNNVDVATAVAASAAYPGLLPAMDRYLEFVSRTGERKRERVILTDGGVYENLGVTCMMPGRDETFSTNVFSPDYIICCDAGPGQFDDSPRPYGWTTRMRRSFEATHRQVQHGIQKQLHILKQHRSLRGFVYAYLGQQDKSLPWRPPDLIGREDVVHYPTDFSPMTETDIDLLSRRGEQLTRLLLEQYCPEL